MPRVNPEILRWARETAGLTIAEAAKKLAINPARGVSGVDRLIALESIVGDEGPTRALLLRMAKHYRRPLLTFYLAEPPARGDRGQDFRTLPSDHNRADDAILDALIRNVQARQSIVRAALEDEEEATPLSFVGSSAMTDGTAALVSSIRNTIKVSLDDFRLQSSPEEAFALLRTGAEEAGVFVLLQGNLGSHHTAIDLEIFRGFTSSDEVAPFVVINDQDSKAAWSFTLLHELTHLWLGQTGVSAIGAELAIERFCNDVAAEFLLPKEELKRSQIDLRANIDALHVEISEFARQRNLSSSMVAYGLYRVGLIDRDKWRGLSSVFLGRWLEERRSRRERARDQENGPSFYVVRRHRVGNALLRLVGHMVSAGMLTTSKAGKVLGVKANQVQPLLDGGALRATRRVA